MADPPTRLYLVTPPLASMADLPTGFSEVMKSGEVACLLLRLREMPERSAKEIVREVAGVVQDLGIALLVEDARVAAHSGADGVHVSDAGEVFADALDSLKPERIVGIGGALSRDDAMRAGEAGADYLLFGMAEGAAAAETLEAVAWWAEIFNVPCVGYAATLAEVEGLAVAGAEFVALGEAIWYDPRGAAEALAEAKATLRRVAGAGASA